MAAPRNEATIIPMDEDEQRAKLQAYNEKKRPADRVPIILRNFESGWPLVQVSLFSVAESEGGVKYQPVLGGGKCHDFPIGAFGFAYLLSKIPGKCEYMSTRGNAVQPDRFNFDNVQSFLHSFYFSHIGTGMSVTSEKSNIGYVSTEMKSPVGNANKLRDAMISIFAYAVKSDSGIQDILVGWDDKFYSNQRIQKAINHDVAEFHNGQIFVDLGKLLDDKIKDPEIKEHLASIFKVAEFRDMKEHDPDFKPATKNMDVMKVEESNLNESLDKSIANEDHIIMPEEDISPSLAASRFSLFPAANDSSPLGDDVIIELPSDKKEEKEEKEHESKTGKTSHNLPPPPPRRN